MIRIIGFIRLSFDLRDLQVYRFELYLLWVTCLALFGKLSSPFSVITKAEQHLGVMLANNAIANGTLRTLPEIPGIALCYRRQYV